MKKLLFAISIIIALNAKAQQVELGANIGNINSLSVGLSTWKWLYIGVSYEANNIMYSPLSIEKNAAIKSYSFYTPMLFLQPTIRVSNHVKVYGAYHYGWFYDNETVGRNVINDYILSLGVNVKVISKLYINGEIGYMGINQNSSWATMQAPAYEQNRDYAALGVRLLLNTHDKHKAQTAQTDVE